MSEIAARALDVNAANVGLGHPTFDAERATFVRDTRFPLIRDANRVTNVRAQTPEEIDRLLARVEREYDGVPHRRFDIDFRTPPEFEARLVAEGYIHSDALILLLEDDLIGEPRPCDIRPVASDEEWRAWSRLLALDFDEGERRAGRTPRPEVTAGIVAVSREKAPPFRYWFAWADGEPRAFFASWRGIGEMGQVEALFTHPDYRHRGLATALIHHCVADCRAMGARTVVIGAVADDTPKQMYAAMGFRPVAVEREYWRDLV